MIFFFITLILVGMDVHLIRSYIQNIFLLVRVAVIDYGTSLIDRIDKDLGNIDMRGSRCCPDDFFCYIMTSDCGRHVRTRPQNLEQRIIDLRGSRPSYTFFAAAASPRNRTSANSVSTIPRRKLIRDIPNLGNKFLPGSISVTRIGVSTSSRRSAPVNARTACLVAQ